MFRTDAALLAIEKLLLIQPLQTEVQNRANIRDFDIELVFGNAMVDDQVLVGAAEKK